MQRLVPPNTACLPSNITANDAGHNTQDGSSRSQIVETLQGTPKPKQSCVQWSRSLSQTTRYQAAMKLTASIDGGISTTGRCLTPGNCLGLNLVVERSRDVTMNGYGMLWRPISLISCVIKICFAAMTQWRSNPWTFFLCMAFQSVSSSANQIS